MSHPIDIVTIMPIGRTIVATGDRSIVDNGDPLAMFLVSTYSVSTAENGEV